MLSSTLIFLRACSWYRLLVIFFNQRSCELEASGIRDIVRLLVSLSALESIFHPLKVEDGDR